MSLLAGRMGRRAFLVAYLCLVVGQTAATLASGGKLLADAIALLPWIWMATKRLHDFNARWWWSLVPLGVGLVGGFANAYAAEWTLSQQATAAHEIDWRAVAQQPWAFAVAFATGFFSAVAARIAAHPIEFCIVAALVLALIFWPGTRGPNRFGDPPQ